MSQWILKPNGNVVPRRTCRPLNTEELHSPEEKRKREIFDKLIEKRWGNPMTPSKSNVKEQETNIDDYEDTYVEYEDKEEIPQITPEVNE